MIVAYHRPSSIEEAVTLLERGEVTTVPMGGGSSLNKPSKDAIAVVDLQDLPLNGIQQRGNILELGATLTLQELLEYPGLQETLARAIRHEASYNLRQVATVAGTLVSSDGRSPFTTVMLALDAALVVIPGKTELSGFDLPGERLSLGEVIIAREEHLRGRLIVQAVIPLNVRLAYEYVARTPADLPVVCVAIARWPSNRTRVVLGGYGAYPKIAMDGTEDVGADVAAMDAYSQSEDHWASAIYRQQVAGILTKRCLRLLESA